MQLVFRPTEDEIKYIEEIGRAIYEAAMRDRRKSANPATQTVLANIKGFAGEFYAAKAYEVPVRPIIGRPDDGYDIVVAGYGVSVKASEFYPDPHLLNGNYCWPLKRDVHALLLVQHDWPRLVRIGGWLTADRFIREHKVETFNDTWGPTRCVPLKGLEPPETLKPTLLMSRHGYSELIERHPELDDWRLGRRIVGQLDKRTDEQHAYAEKNP